jgi:hypothetical protein
MICNAALTQQRTNCNNSDKVYQIDIQLASSHPAAPSISSTDGNGASASAAI